MARNKLAGKGKNKRPKSNLSNGRSYAYDKAYESSPEQIKRRASRNKARRQMIKKRGKAALKGKDVDHTNGNPMNNSSKNLKVTSKKVNRGKTKDKKKAARRRKK